MHVSLFSNEGCVDIFRENIKMTTCGVKTQQNLRMTVNDDTLIYNKVGIA